MRVLTILLYICHNLHATTSSPNDSDALSFQRVSRFVRCRMHELALVVLDTGNLGPLEVVQDATRVDEEFCFIVDDGSCGKIADPEFPGAFCCVPLSVFDLVLELDVFVDEIMFFVNAFQVFEDLWGVGVEVVPCLDAPCELIVDAGNLLSSA